MMIEREAELEIDHRGRLMAVRGLGKAFIVLASISALVGILWVADSFRRAIRHDPMPNETTTTVGMLLVPVAISVVVAWLLFRLGQELQRLAPWSRWAAMSVLVPACIPPLVFFFSAVRGEVYERAALMLALAIPPALAPGSWRARRPTSCSARNPKRHARTPMGMSRGLVRGPGLLSSSSPPWLRWRR